MKSGERIVTNELLQSSTEGVGRTAIPDEPSRAGARVSRGGSTMAIPADASLKPPTPAAQTGPATNLPRTGSADAVDDEVRRAVERATEQGGGEHLTSWQ